MTNYNKLTPFKLCVLQNFPFIEADFDSLTNYELLCKIVEYLNKTIDSQNMVVSNITELNNWFNNLDVQTEINNKLDEMAQDGTLENIINEQLFTKLNTKYTKAIISYDTINDMINDETIEENQVIYVLGNKSKGDGFSAYYKISNLGEVNGLYVIELNNGLYAIMQNEIENNFYNEIYTETIRTNNTDCYLTYIPYKDKDNEQIDLVVNPCGTNPLTNHSFTPNEHARYYNTTLTTNASLAIKIEDKYVDGIVISNGTILRDYSMAGVLTDEYKYIGIKADRTITSYQANATTAQAMVNDGVKNAVLCFGTCVENGELVENFPHYQNYDTDMFLGVKENKDIIILASDGRNSSNLGLTYQTGGQLLIDKGCVTVYCIDSGGSTSVNLRGTKINMNMDEHGTNDRKIAYLFDVKKTITNKETADIYSYIGFVKNNLNRQLRKLINVRQPKILISRYNINEQTITNVVETPNLITSYVLSAPSTSIININNGEISLNLPDQYESILPYQVKIHGHIIIENNTPNNTSHILTITEDGSIASTYRETIPSGDFITFTIDETFNNLLASRKYKMFLTANSNGNIKINGGNLVIEYIPKETSFIE